MKQQLLTLREVAQILGVSEPRVYQLDDELKPVIEPRGTKTKIRRYRPAIVERARARRAEMRGEAPPPDPEACAFCGAPPPCGRAMLVVADGAVEGNLVPCCAPCAAAKGDRDALPFLEHVLAIARHQGG